VRLGERRDKPPLRCRFTLALRLALLRRFARREDAARLPCPEIGAHGPELRHRLRSLPSRGRVHERAHPGPGRRRELPDRCLELWRRGRVAQDQIRHGLPRRQDHDAAERIGPGTPRDRSAKRGGGADAENGAQAREPLIEREAQHFVSPRALDRHGVGGGGDQDQVSRTAKRRRVLANDQRASREAAVRTDLDALMRPMAA
jgi:hypothetical protein